MKKNVIIWVLAALLIVFAIYTVKNNEDQKNAEENSVNDTEKLPQENSSTEKEIAPDFTLKDLNGNEVSLKDYRGKNVYLNFWATWCPPCKAEMPEIEKLYQETKDSDLVILAIDIGEDQTTVAEFISENNYNFNVLLDEKNEIASLYSINSIPVSIFIDQDGYIVNSQIGAMNLEQMKLYINAFETITK